MTEKKPIECSACGEEIAVGRGCLAVIGRPGNMALYAVLHQGGECLDVYDVVPAETLRFV